MSDFTIKRNDTSPAIEIELLDDDDNPVDISGYNEVRFLMSLEGESALTVDDDTNGNVTVTDASNGIVKYEWTSSDTSEKGYYEAEVEVEYSGGKKETFPNTEYIDVEVQPDLG